MTTKTPKTAGHGRFTRRGNVCLAVAATSALFLTSALAGSRGALTGGLLLVAAVVAVSALAGLGFYLLAAARAPVTVGDDQPLDVSTP